MANLTREEYHARVLSIAQDLMAVSDAELSDQLMELLDDHEFVIYTHTARQVIAHTEHPNEYIEQGQCLSEFDDYRVFERLAFWAMYGDVMETISQLRAKS